MLARTPINYMLFARSDVMDRGRWKKLIDWVMIRMVGG